MDKQEKIDEKKYEKMKKKAGEFMKILTEYEMKFSHEIGDADNSVASYIDIEVDNGKVTFVFYKEGRVGIQTEVNEDG